MNTATKLSVYGAALAVVAGCAWAVGSAVGPIEETGNGGNAAAGTGGTGHGDTHGGAVAETGQAAEALPAGLASSRGGYTFAPVSTTVDPGPGTFSFRVTGPDGKPVTRFDVEHEKRMHLIVVRRDTAGFQHVHPEMSADGTWSVPLTLGRPGSYRAFADFAPTGGEATTLGVDLAVPGDFRPAAYTPSRVAHVDGYEVRLDGDVSPGRTAELTLTVSKDGRPVTDLQPYLGAYGHLVALRGGDLAYLHVHPDGEPGDGKTAPGPTVTFFAEVPSAGAYRLFLDFRHGDVVRTAEFTLVTAGHALPQAPPAAEDGTGHADTGHGHN
ncbi:hypothetical protein [Actinophytocola glycyrrhizae]|uniref:Secreted protein n=1 Tax=Actinophytocola glycyrrhizae TaxID=2044873 RepID=A0ABV9S776_9PSEU